jgi:hypothetical protein
MTTRRPTLTNASLHAGGGPATKTNYKAYSSSRDTYALSSISGGGELPSTSSIGRKGAQEPYHPHSFTYVGHPPIAGNIQRYENSYILEPDASQRFNPQRAERICSDILQNHLENVKYEPAKCKALTTLMCEEIKTRLKSITYKRYKIVVSLSICQNVDTNILIASRALWDTATDNCCSVSFKNSSLHAIATVFAVYHD